MSRDIDLSRTASTDPEESVAQETAAVGVHPDTGGLVPEDRAQHAPPPEADGPVPDVASPATMPPD